jgi:hypothetical protein
VARREKLDHNHNGSLKRWKMNENLKWTKSYRENKIVEKLLSDKTK